MTIPIEIGGSCRSGHPDLVWKNIANDVIGNTNGRTHRRELTDATETEEVFFPRNKQSRRRGRLQSRLTEALREEPSCRD